MKGGAPGFLDAYAGGFNLAIVPVTPNTDASHTSVIGRPYFVSVASGASNVTVDTNLITFVTTDFPTDIKGNKLEVSADTGGTYRVLKSGDISFLHSEARTSKMVRKIAVYSFSLKPEEHQPSGTCNFSRIDNAKLEITSSSASPTDAALTIYAVNYNVLRIMSGMGGLAYSN